MNFDENWCAMIYRHVFSKAEIYFSCYFLYFFNMAAQKCKKHKFFRFNYKWHECMYNAQAENYSHNEIQNLYWLQLELHSSLIIRAISGVTSVNSANPQNKTIRTVRTISVMRELKRTRRSGTASFLFSALKDFELFTSPLYRPFALCHHQTNSRKLLNPVPLLLDLSVLYLF